MLHLLLQLDHSLFNAVNHLPHNLIFDTIFTFFSGIGNWGIVWLMLAIVLFIWEEMKDKRGFIALIIAIFLSFIIVEAGIKNIVRRPRPEFTLSQTIIVRDVSGSFSFPSLHVTIAFAGAYILAFHHKKWHLIYFFLAFLIAFSRIYLGKHYPSDVVAGVIIGMILGYFSLKIVYYLILGRETDNIQLMKKGRRDKT